MASTVFTTGGEQWLAERAAGTNAATGQYIGWGTGAGIAAKADTTLFTEAAEARAAGTVSVAGTGATAKWQNVGTLTSASAQTITNAGCFTAATVGTLLIHADFTGIALAIGDAITFTFTLDPS